MSKLTLEEVLDNGEENGLEEMMNLLGYSTGFGECNGEEKDEVLDAYLDATAVLRAKYDKAIAALKNVEAHHVKLNEERGRDGLEDGRPNGYLSPVPVSAETPESKPSAPSAGALEG